MGTSAAIWIDPARLGGQPCLHGHRLTVEHVATGVAYEGVDEYMNGYGVHWSRRRDVLCAAAYWVLTNKSRSKWKRNLRQSWGAWAEQTWHNAWQTIDLPDHPKPELADPPEVDMSGVLVIAA